MLNIRLNIESPACSSPRRPDLLSDGTISIFDNRTDKGQHNEAVHPTEPQSFGYSRILRFDPETQEVLWTFEGSKERPFYTSIQGDHQVLPEW